MKMLVNVTCPVEPFNTLVRNGKAGEIIGRVIDDIKPENIYFTELNGHRGDIMIVEVPDASVIPAIAEPWFLNFKADCKFRIAMTPEDLMKSDLAKLGEKWHEEASIH